MKALIVLIAFTVSFAAGATTPQRYTDVSLDIVSVSETSPLSGEKMTSAFLKVDHFQDSARLVLNRPMPACPAGMFCTMVMPAPIVIEFYNLEFEESACGSFVFTAVIDDTNIDGLVETIEIVDNTYNRCMHLNPLGQYEVTYATYAPRTRIYSEAKFKGPNQGRIKLPVQPAATM